MTAVKKLITILFLCMCIDASAWSQEAFRAARIAITSNVAGARVLVDSLLVGTTPLTDVSLPEGRRVVCVLSGDARRWLSQAVCETVDVRDGLRLHVILPRTITITSEPYGASVFYRDTLVGTTPCIISTRDNAGIVYLTMEGYNGMTMMFDTSIMVLHGVLTPRDGSLSSNQGVYVELEQSGAAVPLVVSASSAVLSGALAAYWKLRADDLYRDYRRSGSSAQLRRVRNLDLAAGIALGVSELSLAVLTYLLVSQ